MHKSPKGNQRAPWEIKEPQGAHEWGGGHAQEPQGA
jgi:hypothetical protein